VLSVNLTTTSQRLSLCRIALTSLLLQSRLPDKINLWVSKDPFLRDDGIGDSRHIDELLQFLPYSGKSRVTIRWVSNTGPYRKLIPVLREAERDDVIVTADDDIFYGHNWLDGLLRGYHASGGRLVAARVKSKRINFLSRHTSYLFWDLVKQPSVLDNDFIVTFGGGAVLTKMMFHEQDVLDDAFIDVAPTADDLWYSALLRRKNNEVVVVPDLLHELNFIQHTDGLANHNFRKASSLIHKVRIQTWDKAAGFLGVPVCGNDIANAKINCYFSKSRRYDVHS